MASLRDLIGLRNCERDEYYVYCKVMPFIKLFIFFIFIFLIIPIATLPILASPREGADATLHCVPLQDLLVHVDALKKEKEEAQAHYQAVRHKLLDVVRGPQRQPWAPVPTCICYTSMCAHSLDSFKPVASLCLSTCDRSRRIRTWSVWAAATAWPVPTPTALCVAPKSRPTPHPPCGPRRKKARGWIAR